MPKVNKGKNIGTGWRLGKAGKHGPLWITANGSHLNWTSDPNLALHLSRRVDADQLAGLVEDCEHITEHELIVANGYGN